MKLRRKFVSGSLSRLYSVVKDLHFGWFVLIPIFSSAGSIFTGLAQQAGYLTAGLALLTVFSLAAGLLRPKAPTLKGLVRRQLVAFRARLSNYLLPDRQDQEMAVRIPVLPERPHLHGTPRKRNDPRR